MSTTDICSGCGLAIPGGAAACQALADELWARDFNQPVLFFKWHRLNVDAYALQHPERYCLSAKSLAAHLGGLCCAVEHAGEAVVLQALQRSLNGTPDLVKPELPAERGTLTIADACQATDPAVYGAAVERWAAAVWAAYAPLHSVARDWLAAARC